METHSPATLVHAGCLLLGEGPGSSFGRDAQDLISLAEQLVLAKLCLMEGREFLEEGRRLRDPRALAREVWPAVLTFCSLFQGARVLHRVVIN